MKMKFIYISLNGFEEIFMESRMICVNNELIKWKLQSGEVIESTHPPLETVKLQHKHIEEIASPFKIKRMKMLHLKILKIF